MGVNPVHLHLLLNHVPTVATVVAVGLLLLAFAKKSDELQRVSLAVFYMIALVSLPTYMTGYPAQKAIAGRPEVIAGLVERHQSAGLLALIFMEATGVVAWFGLWQARTPSGIRRWNAPLMVLLSAVTIGLMANAATIGGEIGHPEIVPPGGAPRALAFDVLKTSRIGDFQHAHLWAWPTLETLHFIGLSLLVGVALAANLRILGFMRNAAFVDVHRLLPWGVWGFVVTSVTGMMFFTGAARQYFDNPAFYLKVIFIMLVGANVLYLTLFDDLWALGPGDTAPLSARVVAASQLFLWAGVIYFGRMLPYIGSAF